LAVRGAHVAAGAVVDATMNPEQTNLANTMRDVFGIDNPTLDALASEPDDNRLVARFKAAAVNAPVGLAADAIMESGAARSAGLSGLARVTRRSRCGREGARADMPVEPPEPRRAHQAPAAANDNAAGAGAEERGPRVRSVQVHTTRRGP
jgi:hypothetical protein